MATIELPRLAGRRDQVGAAVDKLDGVQTGEVLEVHCGAVAYMSRSFADGFVLRLVELEASDVRLRGAAPDVLVVLREAARNRRVPKLFSTGRGQPAAPAA